MIGTKATAEVTTTKQAATVVRRIAVTSPTALGASLDAHQVRHTSEQVCHSTYRTFDIFIEFSLN